METEGSLLCSQEPSTGPYPEPDQSNPYVTQQHLYDVSTELFLCVVRESNPGVLRCALTSLQLYSGAAGLKGLGLQLHTHKAKKQGHGLAEVNCSLGI
jgi:hypothetical protein